MARDQWTGVRLSRFERTLAEYFARRARTSVAAFIRAALYAVASDAFGEADIAGGGEVRRLLIELRRTWPEQRAMIERAHFHNHRTSVRATAQEHGQNHAASEP